MANFGYEWIIIVIRRDEHIVPLSGAVRYHFQVPVQRPALQACHGIQNAFHYVDSQFMTKRVPEGPAEAIYRVYFDERNREGAQVADARPVR